MKNLKILWNKNSVERKATQIK